MLQSYLHRLTDGHAVRGHLAVHGQNVDASGCGLPQGLAKGGVCCVIGVKIQYRPHLDHEQGIARAASRVTPLTSR